MIWDWRYQQLVQQSSSHDPVDKAPYAVRSHDSTGWILEFIQKINFEFGWLYVSKEDAL